MCQGGWFEGVIGTFAPQAASGELSWFPINQRQQMLRRFIVSCPPRQPELRHISRSFPAAEPFARIGSLSRKDKSWRRSDQRNPRVISGHLMMLPVATGRAAADACALFCAAMFCLPVSRGFFPAARCGMILCADGLRLCAVAGNFSLSS